MICFNFIALTVCSDKGIVYSARAYKIPECGRTAAGTPLVQVSIASFVFTENFKSGWLL